MMPRPASEAEEPTHSDIGRRRLWGCTSTLMGSLLPCALSWMTATKTPEWIATICTGRPSRLHH